LPTWLPSRQLIAAIVAIGSRELMAGMELTIGVVALPKVQNDLNLSSAGRNWVIFASLLTCDGLTLVGGRLGDTFGRKRTFIVGVALSTITSVMSAIAWDEGSLVSARLLKGVSIAILAPTVWHWWRPRSRKVVYATPRPRCSPRWVAWAH
jgi:MFS family permease